MQLHCCVGRVRAAPVGWGGGCCTWDVSGLCVCVFHDIPWHDFVTCSIAGVFALFAPLSPVRWTLWAVAQVAVCGNALLQCMLTRP
jgi:hypothetical protein